MDKNPLARCEPLGNRVLIRRNKPSKETQGGILLPDGSVVEEMFGEVLALGPGKRTEDGILHPIDGVCIGDRVVFSMYAGKPIEDELRKYPQDQYRYLVVAFDEVVAVLPPGD